jgi:hypothetical protein
MQTLNFKKANLLPNHPSIYITMNNLAELLESQNRFK